MINYISKPKEALRTDFYTKILNNMAKRIYINETVVKTTMEILKTFKARHPQCVLPMYEAAAEHPESERPRFVRAAKRLGWNVTKSKGHVYENGYFVW